MSAVYHSLSNSAVVGICSILIAAASWAGELDILQKFVTTQISVDHCMNIVFVVITYIAFSMPNQVDHLESAADHLTPPESPAVCNASSLRCWNVEPPAIVAAEEWVEPLESEEVKNDEKALSDDSKTLREEILRLLPTNFLQASRLFWRFSRFNLPTDRYFWLELFLACMRVKHVQLASQVMDEIIELRIKFDPMHYRQMLSYSFNKECYNVMVRFQDCSNFPLEAKCLDLLMKAQFEVGDEMAFETLVTLFTRTKMPSWDVLPCLRIVERKGNGRACHRIFCEVQRVHVISDERFLLVCLRCIATTEPELAYSLLAACMEKGNPEPSEKTCCEAMEKFTVLNRFDLAINVYNLYRTKETLSVLCREGSHSHQLCRTFPCVMSFPVSEMTENLACTILKRFIDADLLTEARKFYSILDKSILQDSSLLATLYPPDNESLIFLAPESILEKPRTDDKKPSNAHNKMKTESSRISSDAWYSDDWLPETMEIKIADDVCTSFLYDDTPPLPQEDTSEMDWIRSFNQQVEWIPTPALNWPAQTAKPNFQIGFLALQPADNTKISARDDRYSSDISTDLLTNDDWVSDTTEMENENDKNAANIVRQDKVQRFWSIVASETHVDSDMVDTKRIEDNNHRARKASSLLTQNYIWDDKDELHDARFEICHFRTEMCPYGLTCPRQKEGYCDGAHSLAEKRRCPTYSDGKIRYLNVPCQFQSDDFGQNCPASDNCVFAHTPTEVAFHPFVYRTKLCTATRCEDLSCSFAHSALEMRNGGRELEGDAILKTKFCLCYPGECNVIKCRGAHSREELSVELLSSEEETYLQDEEVSEKKLKDFLTYRFKTLRCPFGKVHDWQECPYAHNVQDIRRSPATHEYSPVPCHFWLASKWCPNRVHCPMAHGPKEIHYHPEFFQTRACIDFWKTGICSRSRLCAYSHVDLSESHSSETSQQEMSEGKESTSQPEMSEGKESTSQQEMSEGKESTNVGDVMEQAFRLSLPGIGILEDEEKTRVRRHQEWLGDSLARLPLGERTWIRMR